MHLLNKRTGLALVLLAGVWFTNALPGDTLPGNPTVHEHGSLAPDPGWPVWIKDFVKQSRSENSSGIMSIGRDDRRRSCFFIADDVGMIYYCAVARSADSGKPILSLERVRFGRSLVEALDHHQHWDFEALAIDRAYHPPSAGVPDTVHAYLSIEGHGVGLGDETSVLRVRFVRIEDESAPEAEAWRIEHVEEAIPGARFWEGSTHPDRGLKGLAAGERYLHLGLESIDPRGALNVHGTVLFSFDREANLVTTQSTLAWGVKSICGAEAISDSVTILLDRNRQTINILKWDQQRPGWISEVHRFPLSLPGPDGHRYAIPSLEGITVDEFGDIWCVMDPWHGHHRLLDAAPESTQVYMAAEIPMLYRFRGHPVWSACGLSHLWPVEEER